MLDFAKRNPMSIGGGVLMGAISIATLILVILIHGKQSKKCKQNKEGLLTAGLPPPGIPGGVIQPTWNPLASSPPPPPPSTVSLHDWPPKYFNSKQGGGFTKQYSHFACWKKWPPAWHLDGTPNPTGAAAAGTDKKVTAPPGWVHSTMNDTTYVFPNNSDSPEPPWWRYFRQMPCEQDVLRSDFGVKVKIYQGPGNRSDLVNELAKAGGSAALLDPSRETTFNWDATVKSNGPLDGGPACKPIEITLGKAKHYKILQCRHDSK